MNTKIFWSILHRSSLAVHRSLFYFLRRAAIVSGFFIFCVAATAQENISNAEYAARRAAVLTRMPSHAVAVFASAQNYPRTPSSNFPFRQSNNLLYLTGCADENTTLALFETPVHAGGIVTREILFVPSHNPAFELWNGPRMGPLEAASLLGIPALPNDSLQPVLTRVFASAALVYYNWANDGTHDALPLKQFFISRDEDSALRNIFPSIQHVLATGLLVDSLRMIKSSAELSLMQKAIDVSCAGHRAAQRAAHSGMFEYQLQAAFDCEIENGGAEGLAYPDIVGSGPNGCVLHYEANRRRIEPHELVLMDCGAEYHGYAADITRTFPVDGKFTDAQRAIYELVLRAQAAGFAEVKPGAEFSAPHKKAMAMIAEGLQSLGIISGDSLVKKYFPHGTSHTLGMDVHDTRSGTTLLPGMVITVEPGIYIPAGSPCDKKWWNIGVRIEDDVLVTETGSRILSDCVPRSVAEIEAMGRK